MVPRKNFPDFYLKSVYFLYRILWFFLPPLVVFYLFKKSKNDRRYSYSVYERFGKNIIPIKKSIWVHAVSLGEVRSAEALIKKLLNYNETIVMTHHTPAAKEEVLRLFKNPIIKKKLFSFYAPLDYPKALNRFINSVNPKFTLVMERDSWPSMIQVHKKRNITLILCNASYPDRALIRDQKNFFSVMPFLQNFSAVLVKSAKHAERFKKLGVKNISITGELRFDQNIPNNLILSSKRILSENKIDRSIITLASVMEDEEDEFIRIISIVIEKLKLKICPIFVFVPRRPERFDIVANKLTLAKIRFNRRSEVLDSELKGSPFDNIDVMLGDSLGEMYFYQNLSDIVVMGGGFGIHGSHSITEPLSLLKPTIIGGNDNLIEFLSSEAIKQNIVKKMDFNSIQDFLISGEYSFTTKENIQDYLSINSGSTDRTIVTLNEFLLTKYRV